MLFVFRCSVEPAVVGNVHEEVQRFLRIDGPCHGFARLADIRIFVADQDGESPVAVSSVQVEPRPELARFGEGIAP